MNRRVAIHQPHYLPWLGYLAKWAAADVFVFLDVVQYERSGWQNRNRVKTATGPQWLTVPVHAPLGTSIAAVSVDNARPWRARHLRTIVQSYATAPYLERYRRGLEALYAEQWEHLAPLAVASAQWLGRAVGIAVPAYLASALAVAAADPTERLIAICRAVGADVYLAGRDGARYLDRRRFDAAAIAVEFQTYRHPVYAQMHGEFVPSLSAVDLLLMHGDGALRILRSGDAWSSEPAREP